MLAEHLDEYKFDEKVSSFREVAMAEMHFLMNGVGTGLLSQYVCLTDYGKAVLKKDNAVITPYGHLVREDHQPVQAPPNQQRQIGMEML